MRISDCSDPGVEPSVRLPFAPAEDFRGGRDLLALHPLVFFEVGSRLVETELRPLQIARDSRAVGRPPARLR